MPPIEVCIGNATAKSFDCVDKEGVPFIKTIDTMDGYFATNPNDLKALIRECFKKRQ
jgi:hypothetical protein